VTLGGKDILSASAAGTRDFTGKGTSAQSNRLQGSVTVTVMQRLPNGNLVVQGAKNLRLNQGDELVQVQGIVRAADISPGQHHSLQPRRRCTHRLRRPRSRRPVQCNGLAEPFLQLGADAVLSLI
jgi:hypothetical protein